MKNEFHLTLKRFLVMPRSSLIFVALFFLAVRRFPPNLFEPNFYAEDGLVFWANFKNNGVVSFLEPFNGYPTLGLYLLTLLSEFTRWTLGAPLTEAALFLNFFGYLAWAGFSAAPIFLLKKYLSNWVRLALSFLLVMTPLDHYDFAVLGVIGNLKAGFLPLALLLVLYILRENSVHRINLAYIGLGVCLWTNPLTILVFPLLFLKLGILFWRQRYFTLGNIIVLSFILFQVRLISKGSPRIEGYLDEPYVLGNTLSLLARSFFYGGLHPIYSSLNDTLVVFLLVFLTFLIMKSRREIRFELIYIFLLQLSALSILLSQRTGLSMFFGDYDYLAPSQFFYSFNFLALILIFLIFFGKRSKNNTDPIHVLIVAMFMVAHLLPIAGISAFGGNDSMHENLESFETNLRKSCLEDQPTNTVQIYPFVELKLKLDLKIECSAI